MLPFYLHLVFYPSSVCISSLISAGAQQLIASWEAEDFVGWGYKPDSNNFPYVKSSEHSGGYYIQRISKSNSVIYFVNVETEGVYDLKLFYMIKANGGQVGSDFGVRVNDQVLRGFTVTEYTDTDTSAETKNITVSVYLDAGVNMIRIGQNGVWSDGYTPNFEKFELYTSTETLEKPAVDENYDTAANLKTFAGLDGYTVLPDLFNISVAGGNETTANLIDGDTDTKFVSTNETDTIILHFPQGTGFALRNIVFDNQVVLESYSVQLSKDGETWEDMPTDARFISQYFANTGTAIGEWKNGYNPTVYDYRYYRFVVKKIPGVTDLQIGEMKIYGLYQGLEDLTNAENGTAFTSNTSIDGSNGVHQAIDNDITKKFSVNGSTLDVIYKFNNYARVTAYSLGNAASPGERDPKSWTLEASNDSITFIELDKIENYAWAQDRRCQDVRKIQNPGTYKYYRLNVTARQGGGSVVHIGEFQLHGKLMDDTVKLVTSWEAEDFTGWGIKPDANNYPLVKSDEHSGGWYIQRMSQSNSAVYFVNVEEEGVYDLKMYYMISANGGQIGSNIGVRINDQIIREFTVTEYTDTDTSADTKTITVPVYLEAGVNMLRIGQNVLSSGGYTPNFDKFELYTSETEMEKPATDPSYETTSALNSFTGLDGYTVFSDWFTITSDNATINNLVDNDPETKFVSTNDSESFILYFSEGTGFALRNLILDNPHIIFGHEIERSKDGLEGSWTAWKGVNLYYTNTGAALCDYANGQNDLDYKYYRVTMYKPSWMDEMEIGEMKIYGLYQGTDDLLNAENGSVFTSNTEIDGSNGVERAIDNDATTKFCVKGSTLDVIYKFNTTAVVTAYTLANAATPGNRDPKSWVLEASVDSITFVELDKVENYKWFLDRRCQDVKVIDNTTEYKYYRLTVTEKQGNDEYLHIGEFQLFGTMTPPIPIGLTSVAGNVNMYTENGYLTLENKTSKDVQYNIYDITGKLIVTSSLGSATEKIQLNKGIYLVSVNVDGVISTNKIIN